MAKKLLLVSLFLQFSIFTACYSQTWITLGSPGFTAGQTQYTSIAIDTGGTPYVAYAEGSFGFKATVMKYDGSGWVNVGSPLFSPGATEYTSIVFDKNSMPYVAFKDDSGSAYGTTVMKYDGTTWGLVGTRNFAPGVTGVTIAIDKNGTPYVAFSNLLYNYKASVMKFDGSNWVNVGSPGFTAGAEGADQPCIAIDTSGTPYVAFSDHHTGTAGVMKFDGSSWVDVGSPGFSVGHAGSIRLAIDGAGIPYVAYVGTGLKATVMKYNGSSWGYVGLAGFSAAGIMYPSLAIDKNGTPYVGYYDSGTPYNKATVMKYNGGSWVTVGHSSFSTSAADYNNIALGNGTIYDVYPDYTQVLKATVMVFDTSMGVINGVDSLCAGVTVTFSDTTTGGMWSSSNLAKATVGSATGVVTGVAKGTATISYTASSKTAMYLLTVDSVRNPGVVLGMSTLCVGSATTFTETVFGGAWSSSNISVATIGTTGIVNGVSAGNATISYSTANQCGTTIATRFLTVDSCMDGINSLRFLEDKGISIFPNPNTGSFTLRVAGKGQEKVTITVSDIVGSKIKELLTTTDTDVPMQIMAPRGLYIISVRTQEDNLTTKIEIY